MASSRCEGRPPPRAEKACPAGAEASQPSGGRAAGAEERPCLPPFGLGDRCPDGALASLLSGFQSDVAYEHGPDGDEPAPPPGWLPSDGSDGQEPPDDVLLSEGHCCPLALLAAVMLDGRGPSCPLAVLIAKLLLGQEPPEDEEPSPPVERAGRDLDDRGQATTEYGLVMLVAGTLAMALLMWARESNALTGLFDLVVGKLTGGI